MLNAGALLSQCVRGINQQHKELTDTERNQAFEFLAKSIEEITQLKQEVATLRKEQEKLKAMPRRHIKGNANVVFESLNPFLVAGLCAGSFALGWLVKSCK